MADISQQTNSIRQAVHGKEVREALASGMETINLEVEQYDANEANRESNENTRQASETTRQQNESARQTNENDRLSGETTRKNNEAVRVSNENIRQQNETNREAIISAFKVFENYNNDKTYYMFNKVVELGSSYECINQSTEGVKGIDPHSDNGTNWLCIAQKGSDGLGGDMFKSTYDSNNSGVVDDAEKLGGQQPSYYAKQADFDAREAENTLLVDDIKGTIATPTITAGQVTKIDHIASVDNTIVVRSDVFTYATNLVTEVRTIVASSETLTLKYHLDTLRTEVI